jgi:hypothetical protein
MEEELDEALKVDVLAAALRMGKAQSTELLETLTTRLTTIMPETTTAERSGFFGSGSVKKLTIRFDDCHLQLEKEKTGSLTARSMKVVRAVVLKTTTVSVDEWFKLLATELTKAAAHSDSTRQALSSFVIG